MIEFITSKPVVASKGNIKKVGQSNKRNGRRKTRSKKKGRGRNKSIYITNHNKYK